MSTFGFTENLGTFNLSSLVTVSGDWGIRNISFLLVSGTVTVTGSMKLGSIDSTPLTLVAGVSLNLGFNFPIDGLIIDASGGVVTVITGK